MEYATPAEALKAKESLESQSRKAFQVRAFLLVWPLTEGACSRYTNAVCGHVGCVG